MSEFFGLQIALSGLHAQRRGLDVTGHNVANANTEGYSRQRVNLVANAGPAAPAQYARWNRDGAGVDVASVTRLRDAFLEARAISEHGAEADLLQTQGVLARMELAFAEPGDNGLQKVLGDFYAAWDDVTNNPDGLAARSQLLGQSTTLANTFKETADSLSALRTASIDQLGTLVADVNVRAGAIADLNDRIALATQSDLSPNDLLDQRDFALQQLSQLVGITTTPGANGAMNVSVGGVPLVTGNTAESLVLDTSGLPASVTVDWATGAATGAAAALGSGQTNALANAINDIIPRYQADLDVVAQTVRDAVNGLHTAGRDLSGAAGVAFFTGTGASNLTVAITNPSLVAAAAGTDGLNGGSNAAAIAALGDSGIGGDEAYRALIVRLGVEAQSANRRTSIQSEITSQVDAARESVAGVNLDEEMISMVAFQHAYDAAARFMTAVDSALDKLINGTGLVGR